MEREGVSMKRAFATEGRVVVLDVPEPELRPGEVLVAPAFSAISSGTEMHIIASTSRPGDDRRRHLSRPRASAEPAIAQRRRALGRAAAAHRGAATGGDRL